MRCNPSGRWGPGTTKERQQDTEGTREMKSKMEQMMAERAKQDTMWTSSVPMTSATATATSATSTTSSTTKFSNTSSN